MRRFALLLPLLLPLAACNSEDHHPLAGHWNEQTADDKKGITINFSNESGTCYLHGAPREDGTHDHDDGPFTFDEATGAIAISFKSAGEWKGKLADGALSVSAADGKAMTFKLGESAH